MKINANTIRGGMVIEHEGKQWSVIKHAIVQPGKGGAFIQVEMRDIASGTKSQARWRTADSVERLEVRQMECQYLFKEGDMYAFMDKDTYDQFSLSAELIGEKAAFLQDNMEVEVEFHEERAIGVALPPSVVLEIVEADGVVKGQTASSSYKPAKASNGMRIMIPPYMEAGERVLVDTETGEYMRRAD